MPMIYALLALLILGLLITLYLIIKRKKGQKPVCVIGEDCNVVLESRYNHIFGIVHNDIMGLLYYLGMISFIVLLGFDLTSGNLADWLMLGVQILAGTGAFMAIIFTYIQWRLIKAWCFWCIVSNVNTWIIVLLVFLYL